MFNANSSEPELLKTVLEPLLEDFQYWFERSKLLLETEEIKFLGAEAQSELLNRVEQAYQEVRTTQTLMKLTDGQVGVETALLMPWHQLVTECWQVAAKHRMEQAQEQ